jgi:hypothetical protein
LSFSLSEHRDYLEAACAEAAAAPLSARKVRLAAALLDAYAERLLATAPGDTDVLVHRRQLAAGSPALAAMFALAGGTARLMTEAVAVPLDDYPALPLADFMVSLYNGHKVQQVRIVLPDGTKRAAQAVLAEAMAALPSAGAD